MRNYNISFPANNMSFRAKSRNFLSSLALLLAFTACEIDQVSYPSGKQTDEAALETHSVSLSSVSTSENTVYCIMTEGEGFITEGLRATISNPVSFDQTIILKAVPTLIDDYAQKQNTEYELLPSAFYNLENDGTIQLNAGGTSTAPARLTIYATNSIGNKLRAGRYLLPVAVAASAGEISNEVVYFDIMVRKPFESDAELHDGSEIFFVFYLNTSQYDPRMITDYCFTKEQTSTYQIVWYNSVGNILNLRKTTISFDPKTQRACLNLSSDMKYVLGNYSTYILPIKESGRKVCLSIEGGNTGLGFCNMTDEQIEDFASQVKLLFDTYNLDGINLWDRNSEYGKDGMPPMNTTSYPKLIKTLRERLGPDKLLTITDYEEPTEYFWDTAATGGIKVGEYIDFAWSGYCDIKEYNQIVDPYSPDAPGVSQIHIRKPISGLDEKRYGCINAPWQPSFNEETEAILWGKSLENVQKWVQSGYKKNNILVCEDMRTSLQDNYEFTWTNFTILKGLQEDSSINIGRDGYTYRFDKQRITRFEDGVDRYNKWIKDW